MSDETMKETLEPVTEQQETHQEPEQEVVNQEPTVETPQESPQPSSQERNFRELREKAERAQRERDEYERRLREQEEYFRKMQQQQQQQQQKQEPEISFGDDDLLEGKHLKAWERKQRQEIENIKKQYQEQQQALVQQTTEMRIKTAHPDYDSVVNDSNVKELKRMYPEVAQTIASNSDLYSQASTAYTLIKQLGIHKADNYKEQRATAQKNLAKPQPSSAAKKTDSPIGYANEFDKKRLSEKRKQEIYQEMQQFIR